MNRTMASGLVMGFCWLALCAPSSAAPAPAGTLSALEPDGKGSHWILVDPATGAKQELASFDQPAENGAHAWSRDGRAIVVFNARALTRLDPTTSPTTMYLAEGRGKVRKLPNPPDGRVREAGFDSENRLVVITTLSAKPIKAGKTYNLRFKNETYPLKDGFKDGALVRAYAYEDGQWLTLETAVSQDYGSDGYYDASALDVQKQLGPRTWIDPVVLINGPEAERIDDRKAIKQLDASIAGRRKISERQWVRLDTEAADLFMSYRGEVDVQYLPDVVLKHGSQLNALPAMKPEPKGDWLPTVQWPYLLLVSMDGLTHPRLYDLRTGKLTYSSDTLAAASLWPERRPMLGTSGPAIGTGSTWTLTFDATKPFEDEESKHKAAYRLLLQSLPTGRQELLKQAERAWVLKRDANAWLKAVPSEAGTQRSWTVVEALKEETNQRTATLGSAIASLSGQGVRAGEVFDVNQALQKNRPFKEADAKLNRAFRSFLENVPDAQKAQARVAQRSWVAYRDAEARFQASAARTPRDRQEAFVRALTAATDAQRQHLESITFLP